MATITKTPSATWRAMIRKRGWPKVSKTFRTKRDAEDWARRTEDEMARGVYIDRAGAERLLLKTALDRYLADVSATKKASTASAERHKAKALRANLGNYSLAAISADLVAEYRDNRLAEGKSASTVRLELSLLSHLFTIAIKEWRLGLTYNPVANIRKPAPTPGRDRRLTTEEEKKLLAACDGHSNPMLGWIVRIALHTGMRAGEIKTLRRSQVNLAKRTVHLTETKNGSARTVPLTRAAATAFRDALSNPVRPLDTDLIFFGEPGRDGTRRPYEFRPAWHRTVRDAGLRGLRFHDLRHEAIRAVTDS